MQNNLPSLIHKKNYQKFLNNLLPYLIMKPDFSNISWRPATREELTDRIGNKEILSFWQGVDPALVKVGSTRGLILFQDEYTVFVQHKKEPGERYCGTCEEESGRKSPIYLEPVRSEHFSGSVPRCATKNHNY